MSMSELGQGSAPRGRRAAAWLALAAGMVSAVLCVFLWAEVFTGSNVTPLVPLGMFSSAALSVICGVLGKRSERAGIALIGLGLAILVVAGSMAIVVADVVRLVVLGARNS